MKPRYLYFSLFFFFVWLAAFCSQNHLDGYCGGSVFSAIAFFVFGIVSYLGSDAVHDGASRQFDGF